MDPFNWNAGKRTFNCKNDKLLFQLVGFNFQKVRHVHLSSNFFLLWLLIAIVSSCQWRTNVSENTYIMNMIYSFYIFFKTIVYFYVCENGCKIKACWVEWRFHTYMWKNGKTLWDVTPCLYCERDARSKSLKRLGYYHK